MANMDETFLNGCSYNELRRIALENDILKTVKSKKKKVLVEKLIEFFSQKPDEVETYSHKNVLDDETGKMIKSPLKKTIKANRGRKNKVKDISDEPLSKESEMYPDATDISESSDRMESFEIKNDSSQPLKNPYKRNRGRKNISEDSTDKSQIHSDFQDISQSLGKKGEYSSSSENMSESPKRTQKRNRGKALKSKITPEDSLTKDTSESTDISQSLSKKMEHSSSSEKLSESPKKTEKRNRGKTHKSKITPEDSLTKEIPESAETTVNSNRRLTFTVTDFENKDLPQINSVSSDNSTGSFKQKTVLRNKNRKAAINDTALHETDIQPDLPEGSVPEADRRGTFSVIKPEKVFNDEDPVACDGVLTRSDEKKRKLCNSERDQNVPEKTSDLTFSSPRIAEKKVKIVAPVTPLIFNKTVNFMTPKSGKKSIPKRSNISLTPHPSKKSVSTPFSSKKRSGHFSAKKMPNFAKIHQNNFEKMESLLKYTERKDARRELLCSPLNKTFSTVNKKGKVQKLNESLGRKPAKSLIPIRSRSIHMSEKENLSSLMKKIPSTTVESIREKERDIIKGVRANKRFMLQMKMRNLAP